MSGEDLSGLIKSFLTIWLGGVPIIFMAIYLARGVLGESLGTDSEEVLGEIVGVLIVALLWPMLLVLFISVLSLALIAKVSIGAGGWIRDRFS